jgi:hypothetical protein
MFLSFLIICFLFLCIVLIAEIEQSSDQRETTATSQNQQTPQSITSSSKHVLVYKFSKQNLLNDIRRLITLECEKFLVKVDREKVIFSISHTTHTLSLSKHPHF